MGCSGVGIAQVERGGTGWPGFRFGYGLVRWDRAWFRRRWPRWRRRAGRRPVAHSSGQAATRAVVSEPTPFPGRLGQAELAACGFAKAGLVFLDFEFA